MNRWSGRCTVATAPNPAPIHIGKTGGQPGVATASYTAPVDKEYIGGQPTSIY
jgi:hypothetical protein